MLIPGPTLHYTHSFEPMSKQLKLFLKGGGWKFEFFQQKAILLENIQKS